MAVVGLARNASKTIRLEVNRFHKILSPICDELSIFIVESDSSDATPFILSEIKADMENFDFRCLGNLDLTLPDRIDRLRFCRNVYVDHLRQLEKKPNLVFVVDFDIRNWRLEKLMIDQVLGLRDPWDALFANQSGRYYDIFALRQSEWNPRDCFKELNELRRQGISRAKDLAIWSKMRKIPRDNPLIPVDSAFGGLGIYRGDVFTSFDYGRIGESDESEHVHLNQELSRNGYRLFIAPFLINFSWNSQSLSSFPIIRKLDKFTKKFFVFRLLRRFFRFFIS
jgi:hypothetical protein